MSGAIPPLPQYAFMAWCSAKAQGQLYLYFFFYSSYNSYDKYDSGKRFHPELLFNVINLGQLDPL
jgi:hypothetical protein